MKKIRWQLLIIFLTGVIVGVLLLTEQPAATTPPAGGPNVLQPEPEKGGVYAEALVGAFQRLNPVLDFYNPADRQVNRLLFNGLLRFDGQGLPQADLADGWGVSQDGTVYNVTLRSGAKWHDGKALTTDDVLFTVELLREGGTVVPADLQALWKQVDVVVMDANTVQFRLPEPYAPFLDYLTFGIVPRHKLGGKSIDQIASDAFNLAPVGSGPFKFDRLVVENGVIAGVSLKVNENYSGKKAFIDQFIFRYYPDAQTALKAYQEGVVQGLSKVTPEILDAVLANPNLALYSSRSPELTMVLFNQKSAGSAFLAEISVRKALMQGLNRTGMINKVLKGQAILADGVIFPESWAYFDGAEKTIYDSEAAKAALKTAGYVAATDGATRKKGEVSLSFELLYPQGIIYQALAESIQKDWVAIGVQVNLTAVPYDVLIADRLASRNYQAALVDLNLARTPDPDPYPFWDQTQSTGDGQNYTQWDNRMASEYLEQARITVDVKERQRFYRNFQVIFGQELPALPLYYPVYSFALDKQVQGVRVGPLYDTSDRLTNASEWFLGAKKPGQVLPTVTPTK